MSATAEDWYSSTVKPDASVAEYTKAPPRGMTNPPQNPKVRAKLWKELNEQGVQLESEVWPPPPFPRDAPPGPGALELRWALGAARRSPSCPAVFGGVSCPGRAPPAVPKPRGGAEAGHAAGASGGASPKKAPKSPEKKAKAALDEKQPKWIYSADLDKHEVEYEVVLERTGGKKIGVSEHAGGLVAVPERGTLMARWNRENPEDLVKHGDRIVEVNEIRDNVTKMMKQLRKAEVWDIKLVKAWDPQADVLSQSYGSPTARWRNRAPFQFEGSALGSGPSDRSADPAPGGPASPSKASGSPKRSASASAAAGAPGGDKDSSSRTSPSKASSRGFDGKRGKDRGESQEGWQHPDQQKIHNREPTENELRNARAVLKGQSGLHNAASEDRFRFAADISPGKPLCIKGSGTPLGTPSDIWASDGSSLVTFHNGAIRGVNPSPLQPLPEPPVEQKRKKKGADDELSMGDSGLFKPKYPIDDSLKNLRRLKRQMFPEACRREEELLRMKKEAEVREMAQQAKAMMDSLSGLKAALAGGGDGEDA